MTAPQWSLTAVLLCLACLAPAARAQSADALPPTREAEIAALKKQAREYEALARWQEACALYDEILTKDRAQVGAREDYRRCLRQFRQDRRHLDSGLRQSVEKLSTSEAMGLFDKVLDLVSTQYVERDRLELSGLMQEALRELKSALGKKTTFVKLNLPRAKPADLKAFEARVDYWLERRLASRNDAREAVRDLTDGSYVLYLKPGVLTLELACGLCNSLDEYSFYLAPSRIAHAQTAQRNKLVGIGVELSVSEQRLEVSRVYRKSPAAESGLSKGDHIVRIDGQWLDPLAPEAAAERLVGEAGTKVELEVIRHGRTVAETIKVERQAVLANSVDSVLLYEEGERSAFAYVRIHNFQESTAGEVKQAIESMRSSGYDIKGLILDLRGNLGGLFKASIEVTELFIGEGVIVHTYSPLRELNQTIEAKNRSPNQWPMVVLVDGDTASSAEIVAGALKDNKRATLMGQTTFGKGSIQRVYPLERLPGGLRLTVAKFTSPTREPYADRGVTPDTTIDSNLTESQLFQRAVETLQPRMIQRTMPPMSMGSGNMGAQ